MDSWGDNDTSTSGPAGSVWGRLPPGVRSGLIVGVFLVVSGLISSLTGGASSVFCLPVLFLFYLANGALAAYFAGGMGCVASDLPKHGAIAGLVAWGVSGLYYLVVAPLVGIATLGLGFLDLARWVVCGPIDLAVQAAAGALGAWLYGRFAGVRSEPPSDSLY